MLTEIRLYGELGERFGKVWHLDIETPAHAVSAIDALRPGFRKVVIDDLSAYDFHVQVGESTIGKERLCYPARGKTVTITPVLKGAKSGVIQIIEGVVLIAIGIVMAYYQVPFASNVIMLGVALTFGGIASLLAPSPSTPQGNNGKNKPSYIFTQAVNTIEQGLPVPVLLGQGFIGSAVVSGSVQSRDYTQGVAGSGSTPTGGGQQPGTGGGGPVNPVGGSRGGGFGGGLQGPPRLEI